MLYWYWKGVLCPDRKISEYCRQLYFDLTTEAKIYFDGETIKEGRFKDYSRSTQETYDYYNDKIKELSRKTPGIPITIDYEITVDEDIPSMIHTVEYLNGKGRQTDVRMREVIPGGEPINETPY
jgi:hypothetical protein